MECRESIVARFNHCTRAWRPVDPNPHRDYPLTGQRTITGHTIHRPDPGSQYHAAKEIKKQKNFSFIGITLIFTMGDNHEEPSFCL